MSDSFLGLAGRRAAGAVRRLTAPANRHPGQPGFELHPAIRPTSDAVLRTDPRDRLNSICDISDWRDGPMLDVLAELKEPVRIHRKAWEFGRCLSGLQRLGALHPTAHGLSVGAGAERPLFLLANQVERMVATDLYESEEGWGWGHDFLRDPSAYAPFPYRKEALEVHNMSGLELGFPDANFDFVYTLSSIEHFGGHEAARRAVREMARVTKPGGVVCVVTELLLSREPAPELFTADELREYLVEDAGLRLVEPDIDLRISESLLLHPVNMLEESDRVSPHIVITGWGRTGAVWTSVILFFRK